MEKTYTQKGYTFTDDKGVARFVAKESVQKNLDNQTKSQTALNDIIAGLNADLEAINNA
jgi:hypothetical protein